MSVIYQNPGEFVLGVFQADTKTGVCGRFCSSRGNHVAPTWTIYAAQFAIEHNHPLWLLHANGVRPRHYGSFVGSAGEDVRVMGIERAGEETIVMKRPAGKNAADEAQRLWETVDFRCDVPGDWPHEAIYAGQDGMVTAYLLTPEMQTRGATVRVDKEYVYARNDGCDTDALWLHRFTVERYLKEKAASDAEQKPTGGR